MNNCFSSLMVGCSTLKTENLDLAPDHLDNDYLQMLDRLRKDVSTLDQQIRILFIHPFPDNRFFIYPFLCRKMLESCAISLLARIDPLRVLSIRKYQAAGLHKSGSPNKVSIAWLGDIFQKDGKAGVDIWSEDNLKNGPQRSLFGCHVADVAIEPGVRWIMDTATYSPDSKSVVDARLHSSKWISSLNDTDKPFDRIQKNILRLYSHFSKGIHSEYLIDHDAVFNYDSMVQDVADTYKYISMYAVSTHVTPLFQRSLDPRLALGLMLDAEDFFSTYENSIGG